MRQVRTAVACLLAASFYLLVGCHGTNSSSPVSEQTWPSIGTPTRTPSASILSSAAVLDRPSPNTLSGQEVLTGSWVLQQVQIGRSSPRSARPGKTTLSIQGDILHTYGTCGQQVQAHVTVHGSSLELAEVIYGGGGAPAPGSLCGDTEAVAVWNNTGSAFRWAVDESRLTVKSGSATLTYGFGS